MYTNKHSYQKLKGANNLILAIPNNNIIIHKIPGAVQTPRNLNNIVIPK